jgi:hypothetical protein
MKVMKSLYLIVLTALFSFNVSAEDANAQARTLTSGQALDECKQALRKHNQSKEFKFKRNAATRYKAGKFTYWINFSTTEAGNKSTGRAKCIMSKQGELVLLDVESGRWKM